MPCEIGKELEGILIVADMTCPYKDEDKRNAYLSGVEKGLSEGVDLALTLLKEKFDARFNG